MKKILKVFISYKWEDEEHNIWVEQLTRDLRYHGIDALLDKWEVKYGESFTDYMTSAISNADVFLFVMTPKSVEAVESQKGGGVKFEIRLATARKIAGENFRFIGILRKGQKIAAHLRDLRYIDMRKDENYDKQLKSLINDLNDIVFKPPLFGQKKFHSKIFEEKCRLGDEFSISRLSAEYLPNSLDIVVWSSHMDNRDPARIYSRINSRYLSNELKIVGRIDKINFDYKGQLVLISDQEFIKILENDLHTTKAFISIEQIGEPTIRSFVIHKSKPLIVVGTDYGSVLVWDYESDKILWSKYFFPREEIVWITKLEIEYDTSEIMFLNRNFLYLLDILTGEIKNKIEFDDISIDMNEFALCNSNNLLALSDLKFLYIFKDIFSSIYYLRYNLDIPVLDSLQFSANGNFIGVVCGMDFSYKQFNIIDTRNGNIVFKLISDDIFHRNIKSFSFSDDESSVAISNSEEIVVYEKTTNFE